eukprot:jgi/Mesen1/1369/ME000013S00864
MEYFPLSGAKEIAFSGTTLVMPAVSIANVGQLAVDLLIETLGLPRVGILEEPHVLPCAGNDPFGAQPSGVLTVALEVFQDQGRGLTVGHMADFARSFGVWAARAAFREVVILTGADAGRRLPSQMLGDQLRYIRAAPAAAGSATTPESAPDGRCEALGWKPLEGGDRLLSAHPPPEASGDAQGLQEATSGADVARLSLSEQPPQAMEEDEGEGEEPDPGPLEGG